MSEITDIINQVDPPKKMEPTMSTDYDHEHWDKPILKEGLEGRKDDSGKLPHHLLPFDALSEISKVLEFGANKYGPRNWEKGMAWHRPFSACLRHLWDWWQGYKYDPETGLSHLAHAGCCILFLISYELREVGQDDRPNQA